MAKKSLAATVSPAPAAALPSIPGGDNLPTVYRTVSTQTPYVSFVSLKGTQFPKVAGKYPDLREGEPVLFSENDPLRLDPFRFYLTHARVYYAERDSAGNLVRATADPVEARKDWRLQETVDAVILVVTPDRITPARCSFAGTKAKAGAAAVRAGIDAAGEDWGKKSDAHAATIGVTDPRFRFTTVAKMSYGHVSKRTGFKYTVADGVVTPTGPADWKALAAAMADPDFEADVLACVKQWRERVEEVATHFGG